MTKTYELPNEKMIMADIDEKHHTATVSVYALDNLVESVNRTGHWIPVSERLPENSGNYLITYCYEDEIETQEAAYVEGEEEDKWYDITDVEITLAVIAWMPLPKPYDPQESEGQGMSKSTLVIDTPKTCGDCPFCIFTAEEKNYIGFCHTSDDDFYCKVLNRFMEYDKVDGGVDILGKPIDCPLQAVSEDKE